MYSFWTGTFVEKFDAVVTSNGTVITLSLEKTGGGDLTMNLTTGRTTLVCAPLTKTLTPGVDDENPAKYYAYVLESAPTEITVGSAWPLNVPYVRVGIYGVQTAATVQTKGAILNQSFNDGFVNTDDSMGHLSDITLRSRRVGGGVYVSGAQGVATQDGDGNRLWVSVAEGLISQMHPQVFAAFDSEPPTSDTLLVANQFGANFDPISDLNTLTADSLGNALGNSKFLKVVIGGAVNKEGEYQPVWLNLPSGTESTADAAAFDPFGYADFEYPAIFGDTTTPFLIAAFILQHTLNSMLIVDTIDLRGTTPATAPGAGAGGGNVNAGTAFGTDNVIIRSNGTGTDVQSTGVVVDDSNNILLPTIAELRLRDASVKLYSPADGDVQLEADDKVIVNVSGATDSFEIQMSGSRVADFNANGFLAIGDAPLITDAEVQLHLGSNDDRVITMLQVADSDTTQNPRLIFRKSGGTIASPSVITDDENVGLIRFELHNGSAWVNRAGIFARAVGTNGAKLVVQTGAAAIATAFEVNTAGDIEMRVGNEIQFRSNAQKIGSPLAGFMQFDAGSDYLWDINGTREMELEPNELHFQQTSGEFVFDWSDNSNARLRLKDIGGTTRMMINSSGIAFNGLVPVARPNYTVTFTPDRTLNSGATTLGEVADVLCTVIDDLINKVGLFT
jgi:hypothetical protein